MKKYLFTVVVSLLVTMVSFAQTKSKAKEKEKPPTQKEVEEMMKEVQQMMKEMDPEDKRMMDSLGIKMPTNLKMPAVSDKQLAEAWEDEDRIVPKRDAARIAAIAKVVTDARMETYIASIQKQMMTTLDEKVVNMGNDIYSQIKSVAKNNAEAGNMATAFWLSGQPDIALYVLGRVCVDAPTNTDNLSNYAAMLTMQGGQHLAIPLLNNLNAKFPKNSTLLNNLGQAWFGLGEIDKAGKYLDSALVLYPYHPQATFTKAAIEESKGNTTKAVELVKKSIKHSYTKDKEDKLARLGSKLGARDLRLPLRTKVDPMNLGGIKGPLFPLLVNACITLEPQWKDFFVQLDDKISLLKKLRAQAYETAMKGQEQRINADIAMVKTAMSNPGTAGQFASVPIYADRAGKRFTAYTEVYSKKLEAYSKKAVGLLQGELKALKDAYEQEMAKLREEDGEQSGEGKPNKDYCPKYKEASDKYLKVINPKFESLYNEGLQLQKEFLNESAYWNTYIQWPDMFEVLKLDFQVEWLNTLKKGLGVSAFGSGYPFVSITEFVCKEDVKEGQKGKLQEFDDVACQYKSKFNMGLIVQETNCSHTTTTYNFGKVKYTTRELGTKYIGGTLKLSPKVGVGGKAGPITVEGFVGSDVTIELDADKNVKDWNGTVTVGVETGVGISKGPVKAGASVTNAVEVEIGSKGVGDVNMIAKVEAGVGALGQSVEIGVEDRVSLISGHGSVSGTGVLSGVTMTAW